MRKSLYAALTSRGLVCGLIQVVANDRPDEPRHLLTGTQLGDDVPDFSVPISTFELVAIGKMIDKAICAISEPEDCSCGTCHESSEDRVAKVMRKKRKVDQ